MPELTGRLLAAATVAGDWPGARALGSVATNSNKALAGCCAVRGLMVGRAAGLGGRARTGEGPLRGAGSCVRGCPATAAGRLSDSAGRCVFFGSAAAQKHPAPQTDTRQGPGTQACSAGVAEWGPPCRHPHTARTQVAAPPPGSPGRPSLGGSSSPHRIHRAAEPEGLETWCRRDQGGTVPASSPETHVPSQLPASPWINGVTRRAGRRE